jgi:hypothetical protein
MKKHLTLIGMVIGIPVFGLLVGLYIKSDFDKKWAEVVASKIGATEANSPTGHLLISALIRQLLQIRHARHISISIGSCKVASSG